MQRKNLHWFSGHGNP